MKSPFARVGAWCVERPAPVAAIAVLLAIIAAAAALTLKPDGGTDQLVDTGSDTYADTERFYDEFGDEPVYVLVKGELEPLLLTQNLGTLLSLEGCLAGSSSEQAASQSGATEPVPEPCKRLAVLDSARVVYGPATFLNQFAIQAGALLDEQSQFAQREARQQGRAEFRRVLKTGASRQEARRSALIVADTVLNSFEQELVQTATKFGLTGIPRIDDPAYVSSVVFDNRVAGGVPKARFASLFPCPQAALIQIRLEPDLSQDEREETIDLIRQAVEDPAFDLRGAEYLVSGVPVVVDGLAPKLQSEVVVLFAAALILMALMLGLVFRTSLRLLPLVVALLASAITFGLLALVGGSLSMGSIAVLPVLIGLAVDYAIQFQARFAERLGAGSSRARAAAEAAAAGGPVITVAALATAVGFLVFLFSPIPTIRSFGALLVAGVAIAYVVAITAGLAMLSLSREPTGRRRLRAPRSLTGPVEQARTQVGGRVRELGRRALATSIAWPGRVLAVAAVLAIVGWAAGTRTELVSDIRELVPRELPELQNVDALQNTTGSSGEVAVRVDAQDVNDSEVVRWMADYRTRVLELGGYDPADSETATCETDTDARVLPVISLTDLFGDGQTIPDSDRIRSTLALLPPYFSQAFVETDPETGELGNTAAIRFGIRLMPFDEQKELIDGMRDAIDPPGAESDPPEGLSASVVGLPVLAADSNATLSGDRYLLAIAGLIAVALALLAAYRSFGRALVPLIPIALATGWSALILELAGVPLNPMSATLGALVIAIATEFSVLLSARFYEERGKGVSVGEALRTTYRRTGAAVMASGLTAIAGFAALIATDIRMLRDFGIVTVLDLSVALVGVLMVLPAALVWAENGFAPFPALRSRLRRGRGADPQVG